MPERAYKGKKSLRYIDLSSWKIPTFVPIPQSLKQTDMKHLLFAVLLGLAMVSCGEQKSIFSMQNLQEVMRDTMTTRNGRTYMLVTYSDTVHEGTARMCIIEHNGKDSIVHQISGVPTDHQLAPDGHTLTLSTMAFSRTYDLLQLPDVIEYEPFYDSDAYRVDTFSVSLPTSKRTQAHMTAWLTLPTDGKQQNAVMPRLYSIISEDCASSPSAFPTPESVVKHAAEKLAMQARQDLSEEVMDEAGINYSRSVEIKPLWQTVDKDLSTWAVDEYFYAGGAHGSPLTYYLTYPNGQAQPIGLSEIFRPAQLPNVFALISDKLKERYVKAYGSLPGEGDMWNTDANYDEGADGEGLCTGMLYDHFGGKAYPRPALTDQGVVFVYQVYEKDCYAAGPVCILLKWNEIKPYLLHDVQMEVIH